MISRLGVLMLALAGASPASSLAEVDEGPFRLCVSIQSGAEGASAEDARTLAESVVRELEAGGRTEVAVALERQWGGNVFGRRRARRRDRAWPEVYPEGHDNRRRASFA